MTYSPDLQKLKAKDELAWAEFYKEVFPAAFRQAVASTRSIGFNKKNMGAGPADIAQESIIAVFNRVTKEGSDLNEIAFPIAFVKSVVRFIAAGHLQKALAKKRGGTQFAESLDEPKTELSDSEYSSLHHVVPSSGENSVKFRNEVIDALSLLGPEDRRLLIDRFIVGLKQRELEEKYNKKSMGVVIARALERARRIFEKNGLSMCSWVIPEAPTSFIHESDSIYQDDSHKKTAVYIAANPDINGDGRIDLDDLREFRRRLKIFRDSKGGLSEKEKAQLDVNGDGVIDEKDFIALGVAILRAGISPENGAGFALNGDLNNDGRVDRDDLRLLRLQLESHSAGQTLSPEEIAILDVNGDGKLDENDFIELTFMVLANEAADAQRNGLKELVHSNQTLSQEFNLIKANTNGFLATLQLDSTETDICELPDGLKEASLQDFLEQIEGE